MTIREFFTVNSRDSIPPHFADLLAAAMMLLLGAVMPLGLAAARSPTAMLGAVLVAAAATLFAALIPTRIVVTEHCLGAISLFGRNRTLMEPGRARWWGRHVAWKQLASITRMKVNQRRVGCDWRFVFGDLGEYRYSVRVRWGRTYELHDASPAFARFEALARKHVPEKMRDVSARWWRWLQ